MENAIFLAVILLCVLYVVYVEYIVNKAIKELDRKSERRVDVLHETSCEDNYIPHIRSDYDIWLEKYNKEWDDVYYKDN